MSKSTLTIRLNEHRLRKQFVDHEFFRRVKISTLTKEQAAVFIGQWWHPLHYFPTFLARCVATLADIEAMSAVSKILSQETGEGNPKRAHEIIYIETMERAGFTTAQVTGAAPFPETQALVAGYSRASDERLSALGYIFATEAADLTMVSGIGTAVSKATGTRDLEWVNIHVQQEPDHVEEAERALLHGFSAQEEALVVNGAEEMWRLWTAFFDRLEKEVFTPAFSTRDVERGVVIA
jgi:pyrroloquinoline quinone (PQQ) biosynthesis protein C